jgi:hypothetical protein
MATRITGVKASSFVYPTASFGPVLAPPADLIELTGDAILWRRFEVNPRHLLPFRELHLSSRVFATFLDLHTKPDKQILSFAKKNGVLGLCEHGLPAQHGPLRTKLGEWDGAPTSCPLAGRNFAERLAARGRSPDFRCEHVTSEMFQTS